MNCVQECILKGESPPPHHSGRLQQAHEVCVLGEHYLRPMRLGSLPNMNMWWPGDIQGHQRWHPGFGVREEGAITDFLGADNMLPVIKAMTNAKNTSNTNRVGNRGGPRPSSRGGQRCPQDICWLWDNTYCHYDKQCIKKHMCSNCRGAQGHLL